MFAQSSLREVVANNGKAFAMICVSCIVVAGLVFGFEKQDENHRIKMACFKRGGKEGGVCCEDMKEAPLPDEQSL